MPADLEDPEQLIAIVRRETDEAVRRVAELLQLPEKSYELGSPFHLACQAYAARRERRHSFDPSLFADPAWDMLLVMYCAHLAGEQLTVTSVVQATEIPYTSGLRWLQRLEEAGLVSRKPHPNDRRVALLALTPLALEKMEDYFARLRAKGLMLVS